MKNTFGFLVAGVCLILLVGGSLADSFDDFKKQQMQEEQAYSSEEKQAFDQYRKELEKEFREYERIVQEEYRQYTKEIQKSWKEAVVSSKKTWVEYSTDYNTRRLVDFEKGFVQVDMILDTKASQAEAREFAEATLRDMLAENKQTAFNKDRIALGVEQKLLETAPTDFVKTAPLSTNSILAPIVSGKSEMSQAEIQQTATQLLGTGKTTIGASKLPNKKVVSVKVPLPGSMEKKARAYKPMVDTYAGKQKIDDELVLAVIHTESAFNPMATSSVPAYGLMQIVPQSAGQDATGYLFGKPVILSPSYLYSDENNINIGTAYIHILYFQYLSAVADPESRLYCAIAAYNTGVGNVAKAFTGKRNISSAAKKINSVSADVVYQTLVNKLPFQETRDYLQRVSQRMQAYKKM